MVDKETILKIMFVFSAVFFLFVFTSAPKTDCQTCQFELDDKLMDGHEAFEFYEEVCLNYSSQDKYNITDFVVPDGMIRDGQNG